MDARITTAALVAATLLSMGASHRTQNFIVTTSSQQLAREICEKAESDRRRLAVEWLGRELPNWQQPCPIRAHVGPHLGAGGATSFMFDRGRPFGWTMTIQGSRQRLLDSVLPHEVTHTIFATHFGRPLPRWADEGACTTVEHQSERQKQEHLLIRFLKSKPSRGIAFNSMFAMTEYPRDVLPLYAQGFSLARYLIVQGGKQKYVQYVGEGMKTNNWPATTRKYYGFKNLSDLQVTWLDWVGKGSPIELAAQRHEQLAAARQPQQQQSTADQLAQGALARDTPTQNVPTQNAPTQNAPSQDPLAQNGQRQNPGRSGATQSLASPQPPANAIAAAPTRAIDRSTRASSGGSWYLQQHALAETSNPRSATAPSGRLSISNAAYTPGSIKNAVAPASASLSRPQPVGRAKERVIDWGYDAMGSGSSPSGPSAAGPSGPRESYYDVSSNPDSTIRR